MEVHHAGLAAAVNAGPGGGQFFVVAGRRFQAHQAEGAMAPGGGFLWAASNWGTFGVEEQFSCSTTDARLSTDIAVAARRARCPP
jgi:hypothetical protein